MPAHLGIADQRVATGATDTPGAVDAGRLIACTSSSAVTITANDIGAGVSYSVQQQGTGQVTIAAGSGVTLASDKSTASYTTARRWAVLTVICTGSGTVAVVGNTA